MVFGLKFGRLITKLIIVVASVALLITMVMVVVNVGGRDFFAKPILGAVEIVGLAGVFLISFAIGFTEKERSHIVVRMLVSRLSKRLRLLFEIFTFSLSLGTVALLVWGGLVEAWELAHTRGATTNVLHLDRAPFAFVWVAGCIVFCGFLLHHLIEVLVEVRKK
jgi:TRAP-type C4-dicarboxylate transport system permease small subunit